MSVKFTSHAKEVLAGMDGARRTALEVIGGMAEGYAKKLCPVDTGRLRNSITHQQQDENTELIGSNVEYAPYVELGTHKMSARPFLRPAAEGHVGEYKATVERIMRNA